MIQDRNSESPSEAPMIGKAGATIVWSSAASIIAIMTPTMMRRFCPSDKPLGFDISIERKDLKEWSAERGIPRLNGWRAKKAKRKKRPYRLPVFLGMTLAAAPGKKRAAARR